MDEEMTQVNVKMPEDLLAFLDKMIELEKTKGTETDKSKLIRRYVRREMARYQRRIEAEAQAASAPKVKA